MELNNDLITQFAKITKFNPTKSATTVRAKVIQAPTKNDARAYIQIDGADEESKTPAETVVEVAEDDRVIATVKDHSVVITGNKTHPSIGTKSKGELQTDITQTAEQIALEAINRQNADDVLSAKITVNANAITSEVTNRQNADNELSSKITQNANAITSEVTNRQNADDVLSAKITLTATEVKSEVINEVDGKYSTVKQTVEGLTVETVNGKTMIDGGNINASNLNLTGAITWNDLDDPAKENIESAATDAANSVTEGIATTANNALSKASAASINAQNALNAVGNIPPLPGYIESTYIDFSKVESPYIIGGELYAVGFKPDDDTIATHTKISDNGFYLYHAGTEADFNDINYPKISLNCSNDGEHVYCVLGSGVADDSETYNRFYIEKTSSAVMLRYVTDYYGSYVGLNIKRTNNEIQFIADTISELFPIGYIYLSYNHTSPAERFGGQWERLSPYFLYAAGETATIGSTGDVVMSGGTNTAKYIKISAWRRYA